LSKSKVSTSEIPENKFLKKSTIMFKWLIIF
jgi:hypothetical protein